MKSDNKFSEKELFTVSQKLNFGQFILQISFWKINFQPKLRKTSQNNSYEDMKIDSKKETSACVYFIYDVCKQMQQILLWKMAGHSTHLSLWY